MKKRLLTIIALATFCLFSKGQNNIDNPFFEQVDYRGAFGNDNWTHSWTNFDPQNTAYTDVTDTVEAGDISADVTWIKSKVYLLNGWIYVTNGVTLTIEAGTVIRGDKSNKGALIIEPGGKLIAEGTVNEPIIFTSNQDAGSRNYGDWGGVILCGKAIVNKVDPQIEGGPRTIYGGNDDADNSGILKYVRIEFPGIAFQPDKEINGLTFGAVGSGTTIDYIQVSYSGDDSYEWFGGMVNARHLIALRGWDDDFDTDYGYRGMVQFGVSLRDPAIADPGSGSNGFESDNDGSGSSDTPITQAVFSNVSMFGPLVTPSTAINENYKRALHLRRNTRLNVFNSIFAGYLTGLYIEGPSINNANNGDMRFEYNLMAGVQSDFGVASGDIWTATEEATWFFTADFHNDTLPANADLQISDPFNLTSPDFLPQSGSMVLSGSYWDENNISAIQTPSVENSPFIYPNPATTMITLSNIAGVSSIELLNVTGQLLRSIKKANENSLTLDISDLNEGIYFVRFSNNKIMFVTRFTKR